MSRQSQEKRAARAKARAKQRARGRSEDGHETGGPRPARHIFGWVDPDQAHSHMTTADALGWARHGIPYWAWLPEAQKIDPAQFQAEAEPMLLTWLRGAYERGGWQPTEFIRHLSRRGKSPVGELARVVVAVERDSRTGPTVEDPGWLQQWGAAELPATIATTGWLTVWAAPRPDWLGSVHRFAEIVAGMPLLEPLLTCPSGARSAAPLLRKPAPSPAHPMLERVCALLAKAESSQYESEATAFTAKAQELMTKHALDQAMLAGTDPSRTAPGVIRIPIDPPYVEAKALLLQVIAEHSRCQALLHPRAELSSIIGFSADLEMVELLFTSLLVQAHHALSETASVAPPGSRTRSQSFRSAFLQGFASRIDARLAAVNSKAFDDTQAHSATFLPVLQSREEQIRQLVEQRFSAVGSSSVRGGYDPLGYQHGQMAGDAVALLAGAVEA